MKRQKSLAHRRKSQKVSVSTLLQKPLKVSFSLALTKPDSSSSENCSSDEPSIRKKKRRSRRVKLPVKPVVIPSSVKKETKSQSLPKESQSLPKETKETTKSRKPKRESQTHPKSQEKSQKEHQQPQKESQTPHPPPVEGPSVSALVPNTADCKRRVNFGNVEVFRFEFAQGHDTVPAKGGVSLGMESTHHARHLFQLSEYTKYCKAEKRTKLCRWRAAAQVVEQQTRKPTKRKAKFGASGQSPKRPKYADKAIEMSTSSSETEEESDEEMSEQCHVYEPLRRALLGNCGVAIEETVADESLQVAETRSQCGCRCEGQKCVPEQCECALSGIRCQVDYLDESNPSNSFPCSCSASSCGNPEGRVELDPLRIRNHFLQTLMRLKAAKKMGMDESGEVSSPQHILFKEEEEEDGKLEQGTEEEKNGRIVRTSNRQKGDGNSAKDGGGGRQNVTERKKPRERTNTKK
ncbi:hypothetical protein niasHT_014367 [Heterodera trifolii]|uniref:Cysteine/serine-rich nuclear protein N-terminal domain-containing protein n=1 Tax=Heterodera trifolii TaxID=157864 RepID=A0ABD2LH57_9BILA